MKLVVGLGNPGQEYVNTRHNMGWSVVDYWVLNHKLGKPLSKFRGEFWRDYDNNLLLLKPFTYMNLSGLAVREVFDFYKLELTDVLIIYDDIALPFGQLRMRAKGSAGGHNGLASVISCLSSLEIPRLRIGIGNSLFGSRVGWVLGHLSNDEMQLLPEILKNVETGIKLWLLLKIEQVMNKINKKLGNF